MSELIAFMLGGLFVYLASLHHTKFIERENDELRLALFHRMGFTPPPKRSVFDFLKTEKKPASETKRASETEPDLLELQRRAEEED